MSVAQLKAEIVEQIKNLESENSLLEVKSLLQRIGNQADSKKSLSENDQADVIFAKAKASYDNLLQKLAQ